MYFYRPAAHSHSQALQRVSLLKFREHQGSVVYSNRSHSWLSEECCGGHLCWKARVSLQRWTLLLSSVKHPIQFHNLLVPSLSLPGKLQLSSVPMSEDSSPFSCCKRAEVGAKILLPHPAMALMICCFAPQLCWLYIPLEGTQKGF